MEAVFLFRIIMSKNMERRIGELARWLSGARHPVFFTGAGVSTESGLPDFRGPNGVWTRRDKGMTGSVSFDWDRARPGRSHEAIAMLYRCGKMSFLITQNVDNLHLTSGIPPEFLAELHGNIYRSRCTRCGFKCDNFDDLSICPLCGGDLVSSVVDFGDPLPPEEFQRAEQHSRQSDLFVVAGSSLSVYPAADMPRIALSHGAKLVIINQGETPLDGYCHLRFEEAAGEVLYRLVEELKVI